VTFADPFPILLCDDLGPMVAFYRDLLGFTEKYRFPADGEPDFVVLRLGAASVAFGQAATPALHGLARGPHAGNRVELCVYADDVDTAVAKLRAAGTTVLFAPADQPWGERAAYVTDPEGTPVLIVAALPGG
jgi:lactoylglutathione lyase